MQPRALVYAGAAGIATFLVVFVVVSEALLPFLEFSVFVGLPAGLVAGISIAVFVLVQFSRRKDRARPPLALTLGTFGITFLGVLVIALGGFQTGVTISITVAAVLGSLVGLVAGVRASRSPSDGVSPRS